EAERVGLPFGLIADPVGKPTERGLAVLFITHDWQAARSLAERCAVLEHGRLVALGPTTEVLSGRLVAG
ncbi:MAG: hypothetical protein CL625_07825, partial [Arenimonas sp.]|nr:hypothetical protein [Arenimonas sp.]